MPAMARGGRAASGVTGGPSACFPPILSRSCQRTFALRLAQRVLCPIIPAPRPRPSRSRVPSANPSRPMRRRRITRQQRSPRLGRTVPVLALATPRPLLSTIPMLPARVPREGPPRQSRPGTPRLRRALSSHARLRPGALPSIHESRRQPELLVLAPEARLPRRHLRHRTYRIVRHSSDSMPTTSVSTRSITPSDLRLVQKPGRPVRTKKTRLPRRAPLHTGQALLSDMPFTRHMTRGTMGACLASRRRCPESRRMHRTGTGHAKIPPFRMSRLLLRWVITRRGGHRLARRVRALPGTV